jgi:hypothetical protein
MRTYRLFFVSQTEDFICWRNLKGHLQEWNDNAETRAGTRVKWMKRFEGKGWKPLVR